MRSEKEMYDLILTTAQNDQRIRAVFLNGSRANQNVPSDHFQDYDIVYVVTELEAFTANHSWIDVFGKRLMLQMPEAMSNPSGIGHFNWMMLFTDGNRMDLTLIPIRLLETFSKDSLTIPLLDKDGLLPNFPPSSDKDYQTQPPSELDYFSCCNDFWWTMQNVAKGLARDEIPFAMMMYHTVVRAELHNMIDWYIGSNNNFTISPGKMGKYYRRFLPAELYQQYCDTYSSSNADEIWTSVFIMCDLFHTLAVFVGTYLNYSYNQSDEAGMREYLLNVQNNNYQLD